MAVPNTNPFQQSWHRLGAVIPRDDWRFYPGLTGTPTSFKLTAFSVSQEYHRHCFLRIRYEVTGIPIYSRWLKIYPSPIPTLYNFKIDDSFRSYDKVIEIIDYSLLKALQYYREGKLKQRPSALNWSLTIDYLEV
jgi:hypothetical protein